jgi:Secretion system C-terminal sorting domain
MKKITFLTLCLFSIIKSYCQNVAFDFYGGYILQDIHVTCPAPARGNVPAGSHQQVFQGYEFRGVTGNPHGNYYGSTHTYPLTIGTWYDPGHYIDQDGFTLKYPFKAGYKYTITFTCVYKLGGVVDYSNSFPVLQALLTNTPDYTYGRDCYSDASTPDYDLANFPGVFAQYDVINSAPNYGGSPNSIDIPLVFEPTSSLGYLWVQARCTYRSGKNVGDIDIYQMKIDEKYDLNIQGTDSQHCPGTTDTYTLNLGSTPYANGVTWSTTGDIAIQGSNTNSTVTIINNNYSSVGSYTQVGTLTATATTDHGPEVITKSVASGQSDPGDIYGFVDGGKICNNSTYNAWIAGGYSAYEWTVSNGRILTGQNTPEVTYTVDGYVGQFYLTCHTYDSCGRPIPNSSIEYATATDCGPGGGGQSSSVISYPNPASSSITISAKQAQTDVSAQAATTASLSNINTSFNYKIYDTKGKVLKQGNSEKGNDVVVDVRDIPKGNYFLHVQKDKKLIEKQIIITH